MLALLQNLRYALRMLRKTPVMTATILLTLGIGIGAVTASFTVSYVAILTPLPYPDPQQLVNVSSKINTFHNSVAAEDYLEWKQQNHSFQSLVAYSYATFNLAAGDQPEGIPGMKATPGYYSQLGGPGTFLLGRDFLPEEGVAGKDRVVILSHRLWQRLGANVKIIGTTMKIDGLPYTVVGVAKEGPAEQRSQMTVPLVFTPGQINHDFHWLYVSGRLKPGITAQQAQADMDSVAAGIARSSPKTNQGWGVILDPMKPKLQGNDRVAFWLMIGAMAFVLLMICSNVANLLLARGMARQKEIAVRTALGASRRTIFAQLMTESLTLALAGGTLGLAMDYALLRYSIAKTQGLDQAIADAGHLHLVAILFALAVTTLCGAFFGYAPAWFAAHVDPNTALKEGHSGSSTGRQRLRRILVATEFALALALLAGTGLAIHSLRNQMHADLGLRTDHILTFYLPVPDTRSQAPDRITEYYQQMVAAIGATPGVSSVAITTGNPIYSGSAFGVPFTIAGRPAFNDPSMRPSTRLDMVSPEYFSTFGIPLVRGRAFDAHDAADGVRIAIVNEDFARKFLPGVDPLTQRISMAQLAAGQAKMGPPVDLQIVGVMRNVRGMAKTDSPSLLIPFEQTPMPSANIAVRTTGDPAAMTRSIAAAVHTVDPVIALRSPITLDQIRDDALKSEEYGILACTLFAAVALLLAILGIYGVMSYAVTQRTSEIALRMALGAERRHILSLILKEGLTLACIGSAIGLAGAYFIGRAMSSFLYGIAKVDYPVLLAVSLILLLAAVAACLLPAKRAAKTDPMQALRAE